MLAHSGSARLPRATPMKSHTPSSSSASATAGCLMLFTAITGMDTWALMALAKCFFQPSAKEEGSMMV